MSTLNRRELLGSLVAGAAWGIAGCRDSGTRTASGEPSQGNPIKLPNGTVDWRAVRELFPLSRDAIHLSTFLFVSQPKPVAEMVDFYRKKIDEDTLWIDRAAFSDSEGHPFSALKRSIAEYVGGKAEEICVTSNATQALAMAYHGLRIRGDQEILTTEHDHYSQHESIRFASERSGCRVRYVSLYDDGAKANAAEMVSRLERAITPKTRAVGVTWVHSCTGVKLPIPPVAEAVARANRGRAVADRCLLIVDGTHGFGNQDVDVAKMGADFFATSELNSAFRDGASKIPGLTLHTPTDPEVSGGLTCYDVKGLKAEEVAERLNQKNIRTTSSPYKVSYARVGAGIVNFPEEIDTALREIRALTGRSAT